MQAPCLFCDIASGDAPSHRIWEDQEHVAFLSIFPNTPGVTVVIPREHAASYAFEADDKVYLRLLSAAKEVGLLLDRALPGVGRTGLILEGFGVDHLHAKLFPMHGTGGSGPWKPVLSDIDTRFEAYPGHLSSHDAGRADDGALAALAATIRSHHST